MQFLLQMINQLKKKIAQSFPLLGKVKRLFIAFIQSVVKVKASYSQHGEDKIILNILRKYDLTQAIYIDVGSNHPTSISNSYLFYRMGYRGICIEPNKELASLHKLFRKNDIVLQLGCSDKCGVFPFYYSKIPVLSSFKYETFLNNKIHDKRNFWYIEYIPILTLDDIMQNIDLTYQYISFLSIDVEGLDYNVLMGARNIISKVLVVCIEFNDEENKSKIIKLLTENEFELINEISCNLIFKNKNHFFNNYLI